MWDCLTCSLTAAFADVQSDVSKTSSIVVPASSKVHAAVQSVLDEHPSFKKEETKSELL